MFSSISSSSSTSKKKVIVTGGTGLLGQAVIAAFENDWDVVGLGFNRVNQNNSSKLRKCDLREEAEVRKLLLELKPEVVVHCASVRSSPDNNSESMVNFNVKVTEKLAKICSDIGIWLMYISCSEIFDGKNSQYSSNSEAKPLTPFGLSKLDGEKALWKHQTDGGVLRVPTLYSAKKEFASENEIDQIIQNVIEGKEQTLDDFQIIYPTLDSDVALVVRQLADRKLAHCGLYGTWQWSGNEKFTRYQFANYVATTLGVQTPHIQKSTQSENESIPHDTKLNCIALEVMNIGQRTSISSVLTKYYKSS